MAAPPAFVVVWEFLVKPDCEAEFARVYGPQGDWARLFARAREFRGTQLQRDVDEPRRFLTLDSWDSREAYERFLQASHEQYAALDSTAGRLTEREVKLGWFTPVS